MADLMDDTTMTTNQSPSQRYETLSLFPYRLCPTTTIFQRPLPTTPSKTEAFCWRFRHFDYSFSFLSPRPYQLSPTSDISLTTSAV